MNTREYLIELCNTVALSLHLRFAKNTPEQLQHWVEDEVGSKPFISMVNMSSKNGATARLIEFNMDFVTAVSLKFDPSDNDKRLADEEAETQAMNFINIMEGVPELDLLNWSLSETFRDQTFLGIGKGLTLNISLLDKQNYCKLNLPSFE